MPGTDGEVVLEGREGDESCEPEQACQGIEAEDGVFVEVSSAGFGVVSAGEGRVEEEVGEGEEGEAGGED